MFAEMVFIVEILACADKNRSIRMRSVLHAYEARGFCGDTPSHHLRVDALAHFIRNQRHEEKHNRKILIE